MEVSQLRRPDLKAVEGVTHSRKVYTLTKNTLTNKIIYDINNEMDYKQAIIDYISGMSDNYAIKIYKELIEF